MRNRLSSIKSSREHGLGRTDEDRRNKRTIILELKISDDYAALDKKAEEALTQIEAKKYAAGLSPQIKTVFKYGISFWEKECCVKLAT